MGDDKIIYAALLYASIEMPEEVGALALEFAKRRPLPADVKAQVDAARQRYRAEQRERQKDQPKRRTLPRPITIFSETREEAWPDGPADRIDQDFIDAVLADDGFSAFASKSPDTALELLLAICIDEPGYEDRSPYPHATTKLTSWNMGDPPFFSRGPFLRYFLSAPDQAVTFVIKLANFATERWMSGRSDGLEVVVGGQKRIWSGDFNVFRWTLDFPTSEATVLITVLMALEWWLYRQMDAGIDVAPVLNRIVGEGKSIALAATLLTVGKRKPELFFGPLRPLFDNCVIWDWDQTVTNLRGAGWGSHGYWGNQPQSIHKLAQDWFAMPHRGISLLRLAAYTWLPTKSGSEALAQLRKSWMALNKQNPDDKLRDLIERINRANYSFDKKDGVLVPVGFEWPKGLKEANEAVVQKIAKEQRDLQIPSLCRRHLDQGVPLDEKDIPAVLTFVKDTYANRKKDRGPDPLRSVSDIVIAGVTVLIVFHYDWLTTQRGALAWCRKRLEEVVIQSPSRRRFDTESATDREQWDAFAAEAGIALLTRDRTDWLARTLTISAILSYHYATTDLLIQRAVTNRDALGDEFHRIIHATLQWSALRPCLGLADPTWQPEFANLHNRINTLNQEFITGALAAVLPDLATLDAAALRDLDVLDRKRFPKSIRYQRGTENHRYVEHKREKVSPEPIGLDPHLVSAALSWVGVTGGMALIRRQESIQIVRALHSLVVSRLPIIVDRRQEEVDGYPSEFDNWVFRKLAACIPQMTEAESPSELWSDIIGFGALLDDWVAAFLSLWFMVGAKVAQDAAAFTLIWRAMIEQALESANWDPAKNYTHDLAKAVIELLGLHHYRRWYEVPSLALYIESMHDPLRKAAQRWLQLPTVLKGFAIFFQKIDSPAIILDGITWLEAAVRKYGDYEWRDGIEDPLVDCLRSAWKRYASGISASPATKSAFHALLAQLVARNSPSATALRDFVAKGF